MDSDQWDALIHTPSSDDLVPVTLSVSRGVLISPFLSAQKREKSTRAALPQRALHVGLLSAGAFILVVPNTPSPAETSVGPALLSVSQQQPYGLKMPPSQSLAVDALACGGVGRGPLL